MDLFEFFLTYLWGLMDEGKRQIAMFTLLQM